MKVLVEGKAKMSPNATKTVVDILESVANLDPGNNSADYTIVSDHLKVLNICYIR